MTDPLLPLRRRGRAGNRPAERRHRRLHLRRPRPRGDGDLGHPQRRRRGPLASNRPGRRGADELTYDHTGTLVRRRASTLPAAHRARCSAPTSCSASRTACWWCSSPMAGIVARQAASGAAHLAARDHLGSLVLMTDAAADVLASAHGPYGQVPRRSGGRVAARASGPGEAGGPAWCCWGRAGIAPASGGSYRPTR